MRILLIFFLITASGCGVISTAGGGSPNDAIPSGQVVVQGQFSGQSNGNVTGSAIIYNIGQGSYTARLEGLNVASPSETGLQVVVLPTSGDPVATFSLRSSTGSQNYNFTASNVTFSRICIKSTQVANTFYGCAQLQ